MFSALWGSQTCWKPNHLIKLDEYQLHDQSSLGYGEGIGFVRGFELVIAVFKLGPTALASPFLKTAIFKSYVNNVSKLRWFALFLDIRTNQMIACMGIYPTLLPNDWPSFFIFFQILNMFSVPHEYMRIKGELNQIP